jgi:hypothetical protein
MAGKGEGDTFYVQFRFRVDSNMLIPTSGGGWKVVIFHRNSATCANMEITTRNKKGRLHMYTNCGGRNIEIKLPRYEHHLQHGSNDVDGYHCMYKDINPVDCFYYPPDQWITIYYRVTIGDWGQNNSILETWVGLEGQELKQVVKRTDYRLDFNQLATDKFNKVFLSVYNTGRQAGQTHPFSRAWYDELIVSDRPILPPRP